MAAVARRTVPSPTGAPGRESVFGARVRGWGIVVSILAAAVVVQGSALFLPFFADDYLFLDQVRLRSLPATLLAPDPLGNFVRPIGRQLWFWLISRLGESPAVGHALNLILFLGIVALLFVVVRRLADTRAAAIASGLIAIHYAADVPVRWVSGSQDLLATLGALGAIALFVGGRRWLAATSLALALLSKETVVLTPVVGVIAGRKAGERWLDTLRRAWPLGLVTVAWAALWIARQGHVGSGAIGFSAASLPAAFVHLAQVWLGAEWRRDQPAGLLRVVPPILAIGLVVLAIAASTRSGKGRSRGADRSRAEMSPIWTGPVWAAAGALPIAAVAPIWSAYFYLFALCGVALALGAWLRPAPLVAVAAVVALLGWTSEGARRLEEFQTAPATWSTESHVNRFYLDRALGRLSRYIDDLQRQRPTLPHGSTVYFAGVPGFVGLQAADGPLVRWVYRDSSLRSYYATEFGVRQRPGPFFVFQVMNDSLQECTGRPGLLLGMAVSAIMDDKIDIARRILDAGLAQGESDQTTRYLRAWLEFPDVPPERRDAWLRSQGVNPVGPPTAELAAARAKLAEGDTAAALRLCTTAASAHGLDPAAHALLGDLIHRIDVTNYAAVIEALATLRITPEDPLAWRRWAMMLGSLQRYRASLAAMRRYFALGGESARQDATAVATLDYLERVQPGGELVQQGLRKRMDRR